MLVEFTGVCEHKSRIFKNRLPISCAIPSLAVQNQAAVVERAEYLVGGRMDHVANQANAYK